MSDVTNTSSSLTAIVTTEIATRGPLKERRVEMKEIDVAQLESNVSIFVGQIGTILQNTPSEVGGLRLDEIEVSVEITASGKIVLLGVGGEAGISGGLKFVFKRV